MQLDYRLGASMAKWFRSLTLNHLPLTALGSNPNRDFGYFHVRNLAYGTFVPEITEGHLRSSSISKA
jgi:hypothetical protein